MHIQVTGKRVLFEGNYLRLVKKDIDAGELGNWTWETIERVKVYGRGAVVIAAITRDKELILERNWRAPLESYILQFPAGVMDIEGESEEDAARRELQEETGYQAGDMIPIISVPLTPDFTATRATHFFAPDVELTGEGFTDVPEVIEVIKVPLEQLGDYFLNIPADTEIDLRVPGLLWILKQRKLI
ncbi:NUDIX hydrolase [Chloroflexota bacterium]